GAQAHTRDPDRVTADAGSATTARAGRTASPGLPFVGAQAHTRDPDRVTADAGSATTARAGRTASPGLRLVGVSARTRDLGSARPGGTPVLARQRRPCASAARHGQRS
ncbi:hypothetical protein, partial [Streptomyces sp. NPDC005784]|uniref:hypothetical protein n=1 Tax=Streptomyces sp. NPDC005784 TaxID=3364731 RepID=UPI00369E51CB